ncbi:MAG: PLD nuclease N-terminal domain-containing protein [Thermodesulfobacteriota bacterium]
MYGLENLPAWKLALAAVAALVPILPNLWSIRHAYWRDFPSIQEKMIWLSVAVFVPVLGGLAYLFFGRKRGKKPNV